MDFADVDADKWRQYAETCSGLARWIYARESRTLLDYDRRVGAAFGTSTFVSSAEAALDELGDALGQFGHGIELVRFALGAALLQSFESTLVRAVQRNRQALRKEIIASVACGHFDMVGLAAETDDVVGENNFSFWHK